MKFTFQERHTARSTRRAEETTRLSTTAYLASVVGFLKAQDRLLAKFEGTASAAAIGPDLRHPTARPERSVALAHPLETSLQWLICAAALVGAVLGILSL